MLTGLSRDQTLTHEAEGRFHAPLYPASCSHAWGRKRGKAWFLGEGDSRLCRQPLGLRVFVLFCPRAALIQTGNVQLPVQSVSTERIHSRSINDQFKIINKGNVFSSVLLFRCAVGIMMLESSRTSAVCPYVRGSVSSLLHMFWFWYLHMFKRLVSSNWPCRKFAGYEFGHEEFAHCQKTLYAQD